MIPPNTVATICTEQQTAESTHCPSSITNNCQLSYNERENDFGCFYLIENAPLNHVQCSILMLRSAIGPVRNRIRFFVVVPAPLITKVNQRDLFLFLWAGVAADGSKVVIALLLLVGIKFGSGLPLTSNGCLRIYIDIRHGQRRTHGIGKHTHTLLPMIKMGSKTKSLSLWVRPSRPFICRRWWRKMRTDGPLQY